MRASKIRGGSRHIQLAREAVQKGGSTAKGLQKPLQESLKGDVLQGLAKPTECHPGPDHVISEEKRPTQNPKLHK